MFIRFCHTIAELRPYVSMIWVFESPDGIPAGDARLIAPNGCMKLLIPYRKRVVSYIGNAVTSHAPMTCLVAGQLSRAVRIESETGGGTIGIEFKPASACRFFPVGLHELTDGVHDLQNIWGPSGARLQERLGNIDDVETKVAFLQTFLYRQLRVEHGNRVAEYAVDRMIASSGFSSVSELCEDIGYSRQHLARLFAEHVGLTPKEFARIARFQLFYRRILTAAPGQAPDELYDYYYDQSHYIKEFQRFVGHTPGEYGKLRNEFGKLFYASDIPFLQSLNQNFG